MPVHQITAHLKTPVVLDYLLPLESLLAAAVNAETGLEDEAALAQVPIERHPSGLHCASAQFFDADFRLVKVDVVRRVRDHERTSDAFLGNPRAGDPHAILQSTGDYKSLLISRRGITNTAVHWLFQGDAAACRWLLSCLGAIGKGRFGEISRVSVAERDDLDSALVLDGCPTRAIPLPLWSVVSSNTDGGFSLRKDLRPWRSPQWKYPAEVCVLPPTEMQIVPLLAAEAF